MRNLSFRNGIPVVTGLIIFAIITLIFLNPLLEGKKLKQSDIINYKGMSKEISDYRDATGKEALWTDAMFGGMPAYQISVKYKTNLIQYVDKVLSLGLPHPANLLFFYFIGFFVLLLVLKVDKWLSIAGAIAFAFSSYFLIIIEAGHNTKAHAIAYMAPVLAGVILAYRGKYLWGFILTTLAMSLEIYSNHPQITYYLGFILVIYAIYEFIISIRDKFVPRFFKASVLLVGALIISILANIGPLWTTYEYGKESTRGKSDLVVDQNNQTSGLDKDYITQWSYGIGETFSLITPNIKGGSSGYIGNNPDALENVNPQLKQVVSQQNAYWGDQPFTSGPVYIGAAIVFLFILGMFILKGRMKWILLTATILSILLSWGKNFMGFSDFFIDHVPLYNKFRAVSMILVIAELCIPILAILAAQKIAEEPSIIKKKSNKFFISLIITAGLLLLFYITPTTFFSFLSDAESQQLMPLLKGQNGGSYRLLIANLEDARISIFKSDVIRSFFFIIITAATVWVYSIGKIGRNYLAIILGLIFILDLGLVAHRYLNSKNFESKYSNQNPYPLSKASQDILKDKGLDYRVLDLSANTFNSSAASYYHKSIGGYHGAKLQRYQELIEYHISPEIQSLQQALSKSQGSLDSINNAFRQLSVLDMLNTKYVIFNPNASPIANPYAYGAAWLVDDIYWVNTANEEIDALDKVNIKSNAVVHTDFKPAVGTYTSENEPQGKIEMTSYSPNKLEYKFESPAQELAVFSEIYYPHGWNAFIDGQPVPYFRANFVLRALVVPAGKHTITFEFKPNAYGTSKIISLIFSAITILLLIYGIYVEIRRKRTIKE
ncbi:MAG: YfhO family protein [Hyphomicrobiales bacterium]